MTAKTSPTRFILPHHRLAICAALGLAFGLLWPDIRTMLSRVLLGWDVAVWGYLLWVAWVLIKADDGHMKRVALANAENAPTTLLIVVVAAVASLVAVVFELAAAKGAAPNDMLIHGLYAAVTVIGSWLLLPLLFALSYAACYYGPRPDGGLQFPSDKPAAHFEPDHADFMYFSFTIAVTAQTSDVAITTRGMRKLVLWQSVLSFVFNTTILAFSINAAASFF